MGPKTMTVSSRGELDVRLRKRRKRGAASGDNRPMEAGSGNAQVFWQLQ